MKDRRGRHNPGAWNAKNHALMRRRFKRTLAIGALLATFIAGILLR